MDTNTNVALPHDVGGINAEFMTTALRSSCPGTVVDTVELADQHHGSASTFRLALGYAHNPYELPSSLYLKGNSSRTATPPRRPFVAKQHISPTSPIGCATL